MDEFFKQKGPDPVAPHKHTHLPYTPQNVCFFKITDMRAGIGEKLREKRRRANNEECQPAPGNVLFPIGLAVWY